MVARVAARATLLDALTATLAVRDRPAAGALFYFPTTMARSLLLSPTLTSLVFPRARGLP